MFRCPYLDCTIKFEYGSKFFGKLFISFGKNGTSHTDLPIIGPCGSNGSPIISPESSDGSETCFWIQMSEGSGSITRFCYYNEALYDAINNAPSSTYSSDKKEKNLSNLTYMKIRYTFENVNAFICGFYIHVNLSGTDISISSKKCQKWIPPYFEFYSYDSNITLYQEYNFMPGCYLYADPRSNITFDHSSYEYDFSGTLSYAEYQKNYCSGGLNLCFDIHHHKDASQNKARENAYKNQDISIRGWVDCRKNDDSLKIFGVVIKSNANEGYGVMAWDDWSIFWDFYKLTPATFDCYASLNFASGNTLPYVLSGQINIGNDSALRSIKDNSTKLQLYGTTALSGPSVAKIGADNHSVNILGFYMMPLVSNGTVIGNVFGDSTDSYIGIYNSETGIITARNASNNSTKYYAFMFDDPKSPSNNVYYSFNDDGHSLNSLSGDYREIQMDSQVSGGPVIKYQNFNYIFYDGIFIPFNSDDLSGSIIKFNGHDGSEYKGTHFCYRKFEFDSKNNKWAIKESVLPSNWSWRSAS